MSILAAMQATVKTSTERLFRQLLVHLVHQHMTMKWLHHFIVVQILYNFMFKIHVLFLEEMPKFLTKFFNVK